MNLHQLLGMQRAEFARAAHLNRWILIIQLAIALTSVWLVFVEDKRPTYLGALITLVLALLWLWLLQAYRNSRGQAERARRATLLMGGLGENISPSELSDLAINFSVSRASGLALEDPNYYASRAPVGSQRLAEMLEEAAFFSADLMQRSAQIAITVFIVYLVVGLALLLGAVPFVPLERFQGLVRVFCALTTLAASSDVLGAALSYYGSSRVLNKIVPRLEVLRAASFPRADLLMLFGDYNYAVESAPPFVPGVYWWRGDKLNEAWKTKARA